MLRGGVMKKPKTAEIAVDREYIAAIVSDVLYEYKWKEEREKERKWGENFTLVISLLALFVSFFALLFGHYLHR